MTDPLDQRLAEAGAQWDTPLDAPTRSKLLTLLDQLLRWNQTYNLTAIRNRDEAFTLHILDSLSLLPHLSGPNLLDVGTGPGFPALPLAIVRPDLAITALDSNSKKIRFIRQMAHDLGLGNVTPVHARVEQHKGSYQQITSRAFAELSQFLSLTEQLLAPGGQWLAMKSQSATMEMANLPPSLRATVLPLLVPGLPAERCVVKVER